MVDPLSLRALKGSAVAAEQEPVEPQTKSTKHEFGQQGTPLRPDERMCAEHWQEQRAWWSHKGGCPRILRMRYVQEVPKA
eukprot:4647495-Karenia_brevis.AAC.1